MAKPANISLIMTISCLLASTLNVYARKQGSVAEEEDFFLRDVCQGKEKVVKLHFYVQDLRVGNPTPTVYEVAAASITGNSPTNFGSVHVVDDLMTVLPDFNSRAVGRVQGLTTSADMSANAVATNLNFYFTTGRFNGSTISILGRNPVAEARRELPVAGGTGAFRFARGYAVTSNTYNDPETNYSVLEYTIYTTYNSGFTTYNPGSTMSDKDVEVAEM